MAISNTTLTQMSTEWTALPNIGQAIATDLLAIGISSTDDLKSVVAKWKDQLTSTRRIQ